MEELVIEQFDMPADIEVIRWQYAGDLGVQLHVGEKVEQHEFVPMEGLENRQVHRKPWKAFWTSTWDPGVQSSDWVRWCRAEEFGNVDEKQWWLYLPVGFGKLILIDSQRDARAFYARYGRPPDWARPNERLALDLYLDFIAMREDGFVGVHLTEQGQWDTRWSAGCSLYGWDCESTVWFDWSFGSQVDYCIIERK